MTKLMYVIPHNKKRLPNSFNQSFSNSLKSTLNVNYPEMAEQAMLAARKKLRLEELERDQRFLVDRMDSSISKYDAMLAALTGIVDCLSTVVPKMEKREMRLMPSILLRSLQYLEPIRGFDPTVNTSFQNLFLVMNTLMASFPTLQPFKRDDPENPLPNTFPRVPVFPDGSPHPQGFAESFLVDVDDSQLRQPHVIRPQNAPNSTEDRRNSGLPNFNQHLNSPNQKAGLQNSLGVNSATQPVRLLSQTLFDSSSSLPRSNTHSSPTQNIPPQSSKGPAEAIQAKPLSPKKLSAENKDHSNFISHSMTDAAEEKTNDVTSHDKDNIISSHHIFQQTNNQLRATALDSQPSSLPQTSSSAIPEALSSTPKPPQPKFPLKKANSVISPPSPPPRAFTPNSHHLDSPTINNSLKNSTSTSPDVIKLSENPQIEKTSPKPLKMENPAFRRLSALFSPAKQTSTSTSPPPPLINYNNKSLVEQQQIKTSSKRPLPADSLRTKPRIPLKSPGVSSRSKSILSPPARKSIAFSPLGSMAKSPPLPANSSTVSPVSHAVSPVKGKSLLPSTPLKKIGLMQKNVNSNYISPLSIKGISAVQRDVAFSNSHSTNMNPPQPVSQGRVSLLNARPSNGNFNTMHMTNNTSNMAADFSTNFNNQHHQATNSIRYSTGISFDAGSKGLSGEQGLNLNGRPSLAARLSKVHLPSEVLRMSSDETPGHVEHVFSDNAHSSNVNDATIHENINNKVNNNNRMSIMNPPASPMKPLGKSPPPKRSNPKPKSTLTAVSPNQTAIQDNYNLSGDDYHNEDDGHKIDIDQAKKGGFKKLPMKKLM